MCEISSRLTEALLAADVMAARVLCGLNLDVSIPESVGTHFTYRIVALLTYLKGL